MAVSRVRHITPIMAEDSRQSPENKYNSHPPPFFFIYLFFVNDLNPDLFLSFSLNLRKVQFRRT